MVLAQGFMKFQDEGRGCCHLELENLLPDLLSGYFDRVPQFLPM